GMLEPGADGEHLDRAVLAGEALWRNLAGLGRLLCPAAAQQGQGGGEQQGMEARGVRARRAHGVLLLSVSSRGSSAGQTCSSRRGCASATGCRLSAWKASRSIAIGS